MQLKEKVVGKVEQELLKLIQKDVETNCPSVSAFYLEGGHFDPRYPPSDFSINSLVKVLDIANNAILIHKRKLKAVLGILIDDLGLQCGTQVCDISVPMTGSETKGLAPVPQLLEEVLEKYTIVKRERLILQGERNCKNRGIQSLKKIVTHYLDDYPELSLEETDGITKIIFSNSQGQDIVLAESKGKDIWTAKCPLIMAQHYKDTYQKISKLNPQLNAFHIIDFSEMDDYHKVVNGTEVVLKLFLNDEQINSNKLKITNVFLSDFDAEHYTINTMNSTEAESCCA